MILDGVDWRQAIRQLIPEVGDIGDPITGGQKLVFPCFISGHRYALKVILLNSDVIRDVDETQSLTDTVALRVQREVDILGRCSTPYIVKPGPISLTTAKVGAQHVMYFTEEWIEGKDLQRAVADCGPLPLAEVITLSQNMSLAIQDLWSLNVVHRDIKPSNIVRRTGTNDFILLDMGVALDKDDETITQYGLVPGTRIYLSPDQLNYPMKQFLDFRSDLFAVGVVLYEVLTGVHPFFQKGMSGEVLTQRIIDFRPQPPSRIRPEVPANLDSMVMRLLAKKPHLRFRTCKDFVDATTRLCV